MPLSEKNFLSRDFDLLFEEFLFNELNENFRNELLSETLKSKKLITLVSTMYQALREEKNPQKKRKRA
ncbi:MAG: hypothetical protein KA116_02730 [Proteobacteria bacterium]|nr:hypothetical protein [Pseudomonadota bacterium]